MNVHTLLISLRLRVMLGAVLSTLVFGAKAWGQTFTLTPALPSANIMRNPTTTTYAAGFATDSSTWTLSGDCGNVGNSSAFCEFQAFLVTAGTNPLTQITANFNLAGTGCRTPAPAAYSIPLGTSPVALFQMNRKAGNAACIASNLTFTVTSLTYTSYPSSATNYTRGVTIRYIER